MTSRIIALFGFILIIPLSILVNGDKTVETKNDNIFYTRGGGIFTTEPHVKILTRQQVDSLYEDTSRKLCYIKAKLETGE